MKLIDYMRYVLSEEKCYIKLTKNGIRHEEVIYLMNKMDEDGQKNVQKDTHQLLLEFFSNSQNYAIYNNYVKELLSLAVILKYPHSLSYLDNIFKELKECLNFNTLNHLSSLLENSYIH